MRLIGLVFLLLFAGCSLYRDTSEVSLREPDQGPADVRVIDAAPDLVTMPDTQTDDTAPVECTDIGQSCTSATTCCLLGECGAQGVCRERPCTVNDDCAGLQCVRSADSVEARACAEPTCADCEGQNWCHPGIGCTNRDPCSTSASCAAAEVCVAENVCAPTCRATGDCGARECIELPAAALAVADEQGARVCAAALCNCRDPDDYCSVDGLCVLDNVSCQTNTDCPDPRYGCDGIRCVCDDAVPDSCRFGCQVDADCTGEQICDSVLRRCQTQFCEPGAGGCPAGYACAPQPKDSFGAMICRAIGARELGDECQEHGDCKTGFCRHQMCVAPCRRSGDCPAGQNCLFDGQYHCGEVAPFLCDGERCEANSYCIASANECQPFCTSNNECQERGRCVTGFGVYNCLPDPLCPGNQLEDFFSDTCIDFCWLDSDCDTGDCDEFLNRCRKPSG